MQRAAVLIGVQRTGGLPRLADAVAGARRMERWALDQGMAPKRVKLFTDEDGPLEVKAVRDAIRELVRSSTVEQLIVYFAGHGVNIRYGEYWLFSDAPEVASEAVNVDASMALARRCGIPQVVLISDACRTAAEGIQGQGVTGSEIFPNDPVAGPEGAVDIFFATTLGRPALEIKDPNVASAGFKALYTAAFLDAVGGKLPLALTAVAEEGQQRLLVRPRRLKKVLFDELPRRLQELALPAIVSQIPDARITSEDDAWLAEVAWDAALADSIKAPATTRDGLHGAPSRLAASLPDHRVRDQMLKALESHADGSLAGGGTRWRGGGASPSAPGNIICGIRSVGTDLEECISTTEVVLDADDLGLAHVTLAKGAVNALVRFSDGSGMLLPVLAGFIAIVTVEDGEITDLTYQPTAVNAPPARDASLHTVVAESARNGLFRLEPATADRLLERLAADGPLDAALALYAAYALHDLGRREPIGAISDRLFDRTGAVFFDLHMLRRATAGGDCAANASPPMPPFPMLARGWGLTQAFGIPPDATLETLRSHLLPSVWTHIDRSGTDFVRELFISGKLQ